MSKSTAEIHYIGLPKKLADYHPDMLGKIKDYRLGMIHLIYGMAYGKMNDSERSRQYLRQYLCELPEYVAEVRALRPELLEM